VIEFAPVLEALRWDGLFDLEIFSDAELSGSLWQQDPREVAARGVERVREVLSTASA
jgi:sugar phosphate isomerase/epimerase